MPTATRSCGLLLLVGGMVALVAGESTYADEPCMTYDRAKEVACATEDQCQNVWAGQPPKCNPEYRIVTANTGQFDCEHKVVDILQNTWCIPAIVFVNGAPVPVTDLCYEKVLCNTFQDGAGNPYCSRQGAKIPVDNFVRVTIVCRQGVAGD